MEAAAQKNMAWLFLIGMLRRKPSCPGPSAANHQRWAPPTGHRSAPGSAWLLSVWLIFYRTQTKINVLSAFQSVYISISLACLLFCSHYCLIFHNFHQLIPIAFLSTHYITYFPHLLVMVLNINHVPNTCTYLPDTMESKQREKPRSLHKSLFR